MTDASTPSREASDSPQPVHAPWTVDQVASLNAFQRAPYFHEFTCGRDGCGQPLVATRDGWTCANDDYRQDWAHEFTTDWAWLDYVARIDALLGRKKVDES